MNVFLINVMTLTMTIKRTCYNPNKSTPIGSIFNKKTSEQIWLSQIPSWAEQLTYINSQFVTRASAQILVVESLLQMAASKELERIPYVNLNLSPSRCIQLFEPTINPLCLKPLQVISYPSSDTNACWIGINQNMQKQKFILLASTQYYDQRSALKSQDTSVCILL